MGGLAALKFNHRIAFDDILPDGLDRLELLFRHLDVDRPMRRHGFLRFQIQLSQDG